MQFLADNGQKQRFQDRTIRMCWPKGENYKKGKTKSKNIKREINTHICPAVSAIAPDLSEPVL
jgi:hypothetical protein